MSVRTLALSLTAGLVSFLVVAVTVIEVLSTRIWPSAIVGLPAGVLAGVVGFSATYYLLKRTSGRAEQ